MEIRFFQILAPLVALILVASTVSRYRKGKLTVKETIAASIFWLSIGVFSIFPDTISNFIAEALGFKSNVNAIIFLSLGVLLFLVVNMYNSLRKQRKELTELTRQLAIRDFEQEEKST